MNQDPSALRRRARRRLVGAIAIALTAVVVVPMLFDPDPKPLGSDVDIRIPAQESPFEPDAAETGTNDAADSGMPAEPQAEEQPESVAEPTPVVSKAPSQPIAKTPLPNGAAVSGEKPPASMAPPPKPEGKPVPVPNPRPEPKPEPKPKPVPKAEDKAETKPPAPLSKPEPAFASRGYYLQLGAFTSAANANALKVRAAAAGFTVEVADSNGQYRVRVGPIKDRTQAQNTLSKLKAKGFSAVMIGP